jgi:hypothetical protein
LLDSPLSNLKKVNPPKDLRFCQTGRGGHVVKKTHWRHEQWDGKELAVFIHRDPRDVMISQMFFRKIQPSDQVVTNIINGLREQNERVIGIEKFVNQWLADERVVHTRYEWLHSQPIDELQKFSQYILGKQQGERRLRNILGRQAFSKWKPVFPGSMKKGVVGEWKNHYKRHHGKLIDSFLGEFMLELGYIEDRDWWKNLST